MGDFSGDLLLERFGRLKVWRQGKKQAPNKPLLVLYALGRWWNGRSSRLTYAEVDRDLTELLKEFGPDRVAIHTECPFWRLQKDGVWEVYPPAGVQLELSSSGDAKKSELRNNNVHAGFSQTVLTRFEDEPAIVHQVAEVLLEAHFPPSEHQAILARVGLI